MQPLMRAQQNKYQHQLSVLKIVQVLTWALVVVGLQVWSVDTLIHEPQRYISFPWHVFLTVLSIALGEMVCKDMKYWTLMLVYPPLSWCGLMTGWPLYATLWFPLWGAILDVVANADDVVVMAEAEDARTIPAGSRQKREVGSFTRSRLPVTAAAVAVFVNLVITRKVVMDQSLGEVFLGGFACGVYTGSVGLTAAHEMWHRTNSNVEWYLGRAVLVTAGYGHFVIDHLHGHHLLLSDDPATARYGESFWEYWPRFAQGEFNSAWEKNENEVTAMLVLTVAVWSLIWYALPSTAIAAIVFFLSHAFWVFFVSGLVNYVQHYGLERFDSEPVSALHSWQSSAHFTNSLLFNIARHSHHHSQGSVTYDNLRLIDGAPTVPLGYFALVWVALNPLLWFRLMNPLVRNARRCRLDRALGEPYRAGPTPQGPLEVIDQGLIVGSHYIVRTYSFFWFALTVFSLLGDHETILLAFVDLVAPVYRDVVVTWLSLHQFPTTVDVSLALRPVVFAQGLVLNLTWLCLVLHGVESKVLDSHLSIQRCVTRYALKDHLIVWCDLGLHVVPLFALAGRTSLRTDVAWYHVAYAFALSRVWSVVASITTDRDSRSTKSRVIHLFYPDISTIYNLEAKHRPLLTTAYGIETFCFIALFVYKWLSECTFPANDPVCLYVHSSS